VFVRRLYPRPSTGDTLRDLTRSSSIRVGDAFTTEDNSNPAARQAKKSFMILNELQNDQQQTVFILIDDVCMCS
jgi:hypothetical protein